MKVGELVPCRTSLYTVRLQVLVAVSMKFRVFWDVRTSETSVDIEFRTRQHIPEDSELHLYLLVVRVL
jgi:hypothetical protein